MIPLKNMLYKKLADWYSCDGDYENNYWVGCAVTDESNGFIVWEFRVDGDYYTANFVQFTGLREEALEVAVTMMQHCYSPDDVM